MLVQVRDGSWYHGLFHTSRLASGFGVVLKCAKRVESRDNKVLSLSSEVTSKLAISAEDLVQVLAEEITFVEDLGFLGQTGSKSPRSGSTFASDLEGQVDSRQTQPSARRSTSKRES